MTLLAAIDIGNSNVVWGVFEGTSLLAHWRLATNPKATVDEYGVLCMNMLTRTGQVPEQVTGAIISSVVPSLTETFEAMVGSYFGCTPLVVSSDMDTGLTLRYKNPREIRFYEPPVAKGGTNGYENGRLVDPWLDNRSPKPYHVVMDFDGDGSIANPVVGGGAGGAGVSYGSGFLSKQPTNITASVAVYSDGDPSHNPREGVTSW